jgi:hypothetical protein
MEKDIINSNHLQVGTETQCIIYIQKNIQGFTWSSLCLSGDPFMPFLEVSELRNSKRVDNQIAQFGFLIVWTNPVVGRPWIPISNLGSNFVRTFGSTASWGASDPNDMLDSGPQTVMSFLFYASLAVYFVIHKIHKGTSISNALFRQDTTTISLGTTWPAQRNCNICSQSILHIQMSNLGNTRFTERTSTKLGRSRLIGRVLPPAVGMHGRTGNSEPLPL